jgi:hypothetical protein
MSANLSDLTVRCVIAIYRDRVLAHYLYTVFHYGPAHLTTVRKYPSINTEQLKFLSVAVQTSNIF